MNKRTIIIGDVHGCIDELHQLLSEVNFDKNNDRLIFLGDLINKGPSSKKVVRFVMEGGHESIIGNHERGFLKSLKDERYFKRGFKKFYESFEDKKERTQVIEWLKELPLYIEEDDFICIHAGLEPNIPLEQQRAGIATRIRTWGGDRDDLDNPNDPPWYDFYKGNKLVVFGHWAMKGIVQKENVIGLDSGCVWGGALSALILPERKIVSVKAFKQYKDPHE